MDELYLFSNEIDYKLSLFALQTRDFIVLSNDAHKCHNHHGYQKSVLSMKPFSVIRESKLTHSFQKGPQVRLKEKPCLLKDLLVQTSAAAARSVHPEQARSL
jgi:hypothetical protein